MDINEINRRRRNAIRAGVEPDKLPPPPEEVLQKEAAKSPPIKHPIFEPKKKPFVDMRLGTRTFSMSKNIKELVEIREKELIAGVDSTWMWPKTDQGAWQGPFTDYQNSHQHKYYQKVKNTKIVITAGANMGVYVRAYAKMFDMVYAFEPDWLNFYCMSYNCPYPNVSKFQAALGPSPGVCALDTRSKTNMGSYRVKPDVKSTEPKDTVIMTLDMLNVPGCDLLQLDVEGYEPNVLQGAGNILKRYQPVVIIENKKEGAEKLLFGLGYKYHDRSVSDHIYYVP